MPVTNNPEYIKEPTSLQCGQAVLAMLGGVTVEDIIKTVKTDRETDLKMMFSALDALNIRYNRTRIQVKSRDELPDICILSLETPRCWHWSLYYKGRFLDPEHGILDDFPVSNRRYYWEILSD